MIKNSSLWLIGTFFIKRHHFLSASVTLCFSPLHLTQIAQSTPAQQQRAWMNWAYGGWRVDTVPYSMECAVWLLYEWTWQPAVVIGCEESDDWWLQIYSRLRCHCRLSWLPPLKALLHVYMYLCEYWGKKCVTQRERVCLSGWVWISAGGSGLHVFVQGGLVTLNRGVCVS